MISLSYLIRFAAVLLLQAFRLAITTVKTVPAPIGGVEQNGALIPNGALLPLIQSLANNAAPAFGNWGQGVYSGTTNTWAAGDIVGGIIRRHGTQSSADLTDTATNIINSIPGAKVNQTFALFVANLTSGTMTPAGGTGVTLAGTTTIDRFSCRLYLGQVTGSAALTLSSVFQFGGANSIMNA